MKKLQCTKCGQLFWMGLDVNEALVRSGEWIKTPCPKCGVEWAILEPAVKEPRAVRRKKAGPTMKLQVRPKKAVKPAGRKSAVFGPAQIRSMRKRLGISQKELAGLVGVNRGTVAFWEVGKFKPKKEKIVQLQNLTKMKKGKVSKLSQAKAPASEEMKAEEGKPENPKRKGRGKRKKSTQKAVSKARK